MNSITDTLEYIGILRTEHGFTVTQTITNQAQALVTGLYSLAEERTEIWERIDRERKKN